MNTVVLVKLPKIPLLANKESQNVHRISSLSQVMRLACIQTTAGYWKCSQTNPGTVEGKLRALSLVVLCFLVRVS